MERRAEVGESRSAAGRRMNREGKSKDDEKRTDTQRDPAQPSGHCKISTKSRKSTLSHTRNKERPAAARDWFLLLFPVPLLSFFPLSFERNVVALGLLFVCLIFIFYELFDSRAKN